jgi:hypothetical protein
VLVSSRRVLAFAVATCVATPAWADEGGPPPAISRARRVGAVLAALGPGLVLRGAGSWLVHERRTAKRLAATAAIGIGVGAIGGIPIGATGANPYTIEPGAPLLISGVGTLLATWWADVAVAAGVDRGGGARAVPPWSIELATLWLHDARRDRGLSRLSGWLALGRVGVGAAGMIDAKNEARDAELSTRVRILGAGPAASVGSGDRLVVRAAGRIHRDDDDRVTLSTVELELAGRLDLVRLEAALAGQFAELSTGIGVERASYAGVHDDNSLLLGTFAWGVYLGRRGEAAIFYDHRRDSLAGGIAAGRAAGFVGSFGGAVDVTVAPRWAVRGQVEYGNAWVSTLALRYEGGSP